MSVLRVTDNMIGTSEEREFASSLGTRFHEGQSMVEGRSLEGWLRFSIADGQAKSREEAMAHS